VTTLDDCGACERFAVTIDGTTFEGPARDVGMALAALASMRGEDAVESTKKTAKVRAGRSRRTDGRR
jgi:hypothetical protein